MTLVLLDTNTYLRLAKRIRPLLGVKFGQKDYVLTVLKDGKTYSSRANARGIGIVMGAEGPGMRRLTGEHCDFLVKIPMAGKVECLNVSVATGVCLFECVRQRMKK